MFFFFFWHELSYDSDGDNSDGWIGYDNPGLSEASQELLDFLNYFSYIDWIGFTPTTIECSFTAKEKTNIGEQNINTHQPFGIFSLIVTRCLVSMIILQTNFNKVTSEVK